VEIDPNEPPESDELCFLLPFAPPSRQARRAAIGAITEAVRSITRGLNYLLDGYVFVTVEWHVHERFRWEQDASSDVDNILKPLLDAFSGPEGILIDDCQVKSICCSWFSTTSDEQRVEVRIRFIDLEWIPKEGLRFARIIGALCYPVPGEVGEKGALGVWVEWLRGCVETRTKLEAATGGYYPARYVLPHGFFHRTRLHGFTVVDLEDLVVESKHEQHH
jgi:Holliday junction resolvase RusA-like endonuclease